MLPRVSLFNSGIFGFAEMRAFSPFGRYLREMTQRVRSSASRYSVNGVRIREKHFVVLRLL
jgi:mannose-1-phosphate guanylyltransferase